MIEFFLGVLASPYLIGGALLLAVFLDHKEAAGWAVFFTILGAVGVFIVFQPTWYHLLIGIVGYFFTGFIWSFYRFIRYTRKKVDDWNSIDANAPYKISRQSLENSIRIRNNASKATYWVLFWPISMVAITFGDVFGFIERAIKTSFRRVYARIEESAINRIQE